MSLVGKEIQLFSAQVFQKGEFTDQVCPAKWVEGGETLTPSLELVGKI